MKALFLVPTTHEQSLPPMEELQYLDVNGVLCGGWWCVGSSPQEDTQMVVVDTTDAMIETMDANPDYLFLEDITDATANP